MNNDRSQSRGREPLVSSGRGGAGNIRPSSTSRDARPILDGPDDFSPTRGRELPTAHTVTHSGRGGAGNVRSPSRDVEAERRALQLDHARVVEHMRAEEAAPHPHSSGRGGAGNITRSPSRTPQLAGTGTGTATSTAAYQQHHSAPNQGRGGYGNIVHAAAGQGYDLEAERRAADALRAGSDKPRHHLFSSGTGAPATTTASTDAKVGQLA